MAGKGGKFQVTWAAGVLVVDGSMILAVSRQRYTRNKTHYDWGLPGGKAEPFENPYDTAKRELVEETGLQCQQFAPVLTVPATVTGSLNYHVYRPSTVVWGRLKTHTTEGLVRWVTPERFVDVFDPEMSVAQSNRYILYWALGWHV